MTAPQCSTRTAQGSASPWGRVPERGWPGAEQRPRSPGGGRTCTRVGARSRPSSPVGGATVSPWDAEQLRKHTPPPQEGGGGEAPSRGQSRVQPAPRRAQRLGAPPPQLRCPRRGTVPSMRGGGCRPLPTACWAHTGPSASGSALGPRRLSKRIKGRRRPLSAAGQSLPGTWDTPQRQGVLSAPLPRRGPCCLSPGHVVCEGAPRQRSEGRPGPSPAARPPPPAGLAPAHAPAPSPAHGLRRGAAVPAPP